jgi:hypothetical protein
MDEKWDGCRCLSVYHESLSRYKIKTMIVFLSLGTIILP